MSSAIPILTYLYLSYLLTQLICARTKSPQKCLLLCKAWNMPVFFSICFYLHINVTNDYDSITKTLVMGVKLMTDRYKKYSHKN